MKFYIGATDVDTGKPVYHRCSDGGRKDIEWMRAYASMPLVSRPVQIGKYTLFDGEIMDPVSYRYMEMRGHDRNVIILTRPEGYRKKPAPSIMIRMLGKYPEIAKAMAVRHIRYNRQMEEIREMELAGRATVICPLEDLKVGRTEKDPEELERVYQTGRLAAVHLLGRVKEFQL